MSYWFRNDNRLPQGRLAVASYVIVGMIGVLLIGFWKLQVIDSDSYTSMAERNRVRAIPVIAPRGRMLDRDGRVLVDNRPSFSVLLLRDDSGLIEKHLPSIADGLDISLEDLRSQMASTKNLPKFQPIIIKPEASPADIAFIESHRSDIPILEMISVSRRRYLPGGFLAHAVGYVGEVSEQQIEASNGKLRPGDIAGKSGLERQYNDLLQGTDGMRRVVVNSVGKEVDRLSTQEAIPGKQIKLTIDFDLQQVAEQSLGDRPGAVVALDPRTGEVLAMVSRPTPDPNDFAVRISSGGVEGSQRRPSTSSAESRDSGATRARLGLQDRHRDGHARRPCSRAELHHVLPGLRHVLRAAVSSAGFTTRRPARNRMASPTCTKPS